MFGGLILDLQKSCEDNIEGSCTPFSLFPLMVTPYTSMIYLSKLKSIGTLLSLSSRLHLSFTNFSANVLFLSQGPISDGTWSSSCISWTPLFLKTLFDLVGAFPLNTFLILSLQRYRFYSEFYQHWKNFTEKIFLQWIPLQDTLIPQQFFHPVQLNYYYVFPHFIIFFFNRSFSQLGKLPKIYGSPITFCLYVNAVHHGLWQGIFLDDHTSPKINFPGSNFSCPDFAKTILISLLISKMSILHVRVTFCWFYFVWVF